MAYACAVAVEKQLHEGITELRAVELMREYLADHGVHEYFHLPVAWFGDRSTLMNFRRHDFFPTSRRLNGGDAVILDVAPVIDGHASDIGYACSLGENKLQAQMMQDLYAYRSLILEGVKARKNLSDIYRDVDRLIQSQGYQNRHQAYTNRVIGHRVTWTPERDRSRRTFAGFGWPTVKAVVAANVMMKFTPGFQSPEWNDQTSSDHPAGPGLWAVEPHLGFRGNGAKWEELMVVTETDAYWLDDNVPHVQRYRPKPVTTSVDAHAAMS